jgi:hypothetical protein
MKQFSFLALLTLFFFVGPNVLSQPLVLKAKAIPKKDKVTPPESFERLVDIDYGFFVTKTKIPWGVDPFQKEPGFAKVDSPREKFVLTGILYSKDEPVAIVNGISLKIGDLVGDRHVTEIGENFVILKKQDSEIELNLPPVQDPASDADSDDGEDEESGQ